MEQARATDDVALTLTNREFARLAGISEATWYKRFARGEFEGLRSGLGDRWSREKVEAFLGGRTLDPPRHKAAIA